MITGILLIIGALVLIYLLLTILNYTVEGSNTVRESFTFVGKVMIIFICVSALVIIAFWLFIEGITHLKNALT